MLIGLGIGSAGALPQALLAQDVPPPAVTGAVAPQTFDLDSGTYTIDGGAAFAGPDLAFTTTLPHGGITIDPASGVITVDTGLTGALDDLPITVRAVNGGGIAEVSFPLRVATLGNFLTSFDGLTVNPSLGPTAEIGSVISAIVPGVDGPISYQWLADGLAIAGANAADLTVPAGADGTVLSCRILPDGLGEQTVPVAPVRFAPPTALGGLLDRTFASLSGVQTYDVTVDFSVAGDPALAGAVWSLETPPIGVSISQSGLLAIDTAQTAAQSGQTIVVRLENTGGSVTSAFDLNIATPASLAITDISVDPQDFAGNVVVSYGVSEDVAVDLVMTNSATQPTPAQVSAGQDHTGTAAVDAFQALNWTISPGAASMALADGLDEPEIWFHATHPGSEAVATGGPVTVDTALPQITGLAGVANGPLAADWSFGTDEAGAYALGLWPSAATPNAAEVMAGTGAVYFVTDRANAAGTVSGTATGLVASTGYKLHLGFDDETGNVALAASPAFTTGGAIAANFAYVGGVAVETTDGTSEHGFTLEAGRTYAGLVFSRGSDFTSISVSSGDGITLRGGALSASGDVRGQAFEFNAEAGGATDIVAAVTSTTEQVFVFLYDVTGLAYVDTQFDLSTNGSTTKAAFAIDTQSGDRILAGAMIQDGTGLFDAVVGFDQVDGSLNEIWSAGAASAATAAGGTGEVFELQFTSNFKNGGGIAVVYR